MIQYIRNTCIQIHIRFKAYLFSIINSKIKVYICVRIYIYIYINNLHNKEQENALNLYA